MYFREDDFKEFIVMIEDIYGKKASKLLKSCIEAKVDSKNFLIKEFYKSHSKYLNKQKKFKHDFIEFLLEKNPKADVTFKDVEAQDDLIIGLLLMNDSLKNRLTGNSMFGDLTFDKISTTVSERINVKDRDNNLQSLLGFHSVFGVSFFGMITDTGYNKLYQVVFFDGTDIGTFIPSEGNLRVLYEDKYDICSLEIKKEIITFTNKEILVNVNDKKFSDSLNDLKNSITDDLTKSIINSFLEKITKGEGILWE